MEKPPEEHPVETPQARFFLLSLGALGLLILGLGLSLVETRKQFAAAGETEEVVLTPDPFADIELTARAAMVYDLHRDEVLFSRNVEIQWPLASLTKLMTALVAAETLENDAVVIVRREDIAAEGDSGFKAGERWLLKNLIDFTLVSSSNDGASALSAAVAAALPEESAIERMNRRARELGLTQTYFVNETGLDQGLTAAGGYGSARDLARLVGHIVLSNPEILDRTRLKEIDLSSESALHTAKNTNTALGAIPGLIGSKTGFTDLAGGNLAVAFDAGLNHPVIVVVLGSTADGRFSDAVSLAHAAAARIALGVE